MFGLSSKLGITDKEAAETLLTLSTKKGVTIRRWDNRGFHPKLFIIYGESIFIVVGSSNLTKAAQSKNAEANVLVKIEEKNNEFLKDAEKFFKFYFDTAPDLTQDDVKKYTSATNKISERASKIKGEEDTLPSPVQIKEKLISPQPKKIWKISPGKKARYWKSEWLQFIKDNGDGFVAIGWNEVGDLKRFSSYSELKREVARQAKRVWGEKTKIKYTTDQLWNFKNQISEGDVFIIYSACRVLGIAEVTKESKYYYNKSKSVTYAHQINVKYRWYEEWPRKADKKIIKILGKQVTLIEVKEKRIWNYLIKNYLEPVKGKSK